MTLLFISFIGGVLTILSPCVLPLLPIIIGGSLTNNQRSRPLIITASLSFSIVAFTLMLKWSTTLIAVPSHTWSIISGTLLIALGIVTLFPKLWEFISVRLKFSDKSNKLLAKSGQQKNVLGSILVGLALGPVFSSCSPTYALILATVLPASFAVGLVNLIMYAIGLSLVLFLIALFGQKFIHKIQWAADPEGWFKKVIGILFILVGLAIITGVEKKIETVLVERGFGITQFEEQLINTTTQEMDAEPVKNNTLQNELNVKKPYAAPELQGIAGWINSEPLLLESLKGKVVVIDFWTYSCINCIRTLPSLQEWHEQYADDGLVIIGVHSPEFAFEKIPGNVQSAVEEYGIQYPVALDNNFNTWQAYQNKYWPAKYFIDREGNVRHTHFGEGEYEESEKVIQLLLQETGVDVNVDEVITKSEALPISAQQTPETYLGYARIDRFTNTQELQPNKTHTYTLKENLSQDTWSLGGDWIIKNEKAVSGSTGAKLAIDVSGKSVYLVMGAASPKKVHVLMNGKSVSEADAGADVQDSYLNVDEYRLYRIIESDLFLNEAVIELQFDSGIEAHAFTFGS